jgi:hypothetical protein
MAAALALNSSEVVEMADLTLGMAFGPIASKRCLVANRAGQGCVNLLSTSRMRHGLRGKAGGADSVRGRMERFDI